MWPQSTIATLQFYNTDFIILLSDTIRQSNVYYCGTVIQYPKSCLTGRVVVRCVEGPWKHFKVSQFCWNSISLGCIHPLTEEIPKEFT